MQIPSHITMEEMMAEAELFQSVYPVLIGEIERVERARGKLNDFQLMMAVSYAKNGLGVLSYERRQTINAIFQAFTVIYRNEGRIAADRWAQEYFGCRRAAEDSEDLSEVSDRLYELSVLIQEKETELLKFYGEYYMLQNYIGREER